MIQRSAPPPFPEALDDDDDDVTWALHTALVQWKRGAHGDAIKWLRRAAESAEDDGRAVRAHELTHQTNALEAALDTGWAPRPDSAPSTEELDDPSGSLPARRAHASGDRGSSAPPAEVDSSSPESPTPPVNPFSAEPEDNPFEPASSDDSPASAEPDEGTEFDSSSLRDSGEYREVAVDIDFPPASIVPPFRPNESTPPTEIDDDELIEDAEPLTVDDFEDVGEADLVPRSAASPASEGADALQDADIIEALDESEQPTPPTPAKQRPAVLVPSSLRDEIDELLGKAPRRLRFSGSAGSSVKPSSTGRGKSEPSVRPGALPLDDDPTERGLDTVPEICEPNLPAEPTAEETTEPRAPTPRLREEPVPGDSTQSQRQSEPGTIPPLRGSFEQSDSTQPTGPRTLPAEPIREPPSEPASNNQPERGSTPFLARMPAWATAGRPPSTTGPESDPPVVFSVVPTAFSEPAPGPLPPDAPPASVSPPSPTEIFGVSLTEVTGLEELPEEAQAHLVKTAKISTLAANEEIASFGLSLVLEGMVSVMPEVADVAAAQARRGELVFSQGHIEEELRLRIVAGESGARVATWPFEAFSITVTDCPWVLDELKRVGDRLQALAGVTMGPMGDQLDDMLRALVIERCEVKRLLPGEVLAQAGKPVPGMVIVGAGRLEVSEGAGESARVVQELHPGDFLFAPQILQASPAPGTARAGKGGALVLFAERKVAHELLVGVPPLLGIFAC